MASDVGEIGSVARAREWNCPLTAHVVWDTSRLEECVVSVRMVHDTSRLVDVVWDTQTNTKAGVGCI